MKTVWISPAEAHHRRMSRKERKSRYAAQKAAANESRPDLSFSLLANELNKRAA